jgi:hypothetical protein
MVVEGKMNGVHLLVLLVLLFMLGLVVFTNSEPEMLTELKYRYFKTLDILRETGDPIWEPVLKPAIITGLNGKKDGVIGSNVNKGYEIYICLDGDDVNSAFYVLIHELAHMTVPEYDHSIKFWDNFEKLKKICIDNGLYLKSGERKYCGDAIRD